MSKGRPSVLFVCIHNAGRSQMAAGFARQIAPGCLDIRSAGSSPADVVNPLVVEAMAEIGIEIGAEVPTLVTAEMAAAADVIVTMGCGDACPFFSGVRYLDWALEDPAGKTLKAIRQIREEIRSRVEQLVAELLA